MKHLARAVYKISTIVCLCASLIAGFLSFNVYGQSTTEQQVMGTEVDRTKAAVEALADSHPIHIGIFRFLPSVSFHSGYDSNALFTENEVIGDYFVSARPSLSTGVKLGHRAFVRAIEDVTFLYYRRLTQRRDIFNTTRGEIVTGTSRMLVNLFGSYDKRKAPVDEEIDVPIQHSNITAGAGVAYLLGTRLDFRPALRWTQTKFDLTDESNNLALSLRDHQVITGSAGLDYIFRTNLRFTSDFSIGRSSHTNETTTDSSDNSSVFWSALFGATFTGRRLVGHLGFGFGEANLGEENRSNRFLLLGNVDYQLATRIRLGVFAAREYQTSAFLDAAVRLTTRYGIRTGLLLTRRLSVGLNYSRGHNDYGDSLVAGERVNNDAFQSAGATLGIRLIRNISLRLGVTYSKRDSDIAILNKDRFTYRIGLGLSYSFQPGHDDDSENQ